MRERPVLVQPPFNGVYMTLPFSCAPLNTPAETVPAIAWVVTGFPGTSVTLMLIVSISAFFIHQIRMWGPWSPIHLLAVYTLIMLPVGVIAAHRHVIERHRRTMVGIFIGGLVIAGVFTFYPGRIMYHVVFGGN